MRPDLILFQFISKPVYANCPICIVTVGGGLFIAKKLGIDDLLVSIWLSGLNSAIAFWIASTMKRKLLNNGLLWSLGFYIMTLLYLVLSKQVGHKGNLFLGIDKVVFGMTVGFIVFFIASFIDKFIRKINGGKVIIYYQKVIIPLLFLTVVTVFFKIIL